MKIWITEIGEPLPMEPDARLMRYGILSPLLAAMGHEVTWWTSSFSHTARKHFRNSDGEEMFQKVRLKVLHGPGYGRSVSLQRLRHQALFAERFYASALIEPKPDLILTPIPTLETAKKAVRFGKEHKVPVLVDIRDEWPEEFVDLAPRPFRSLMRLLLTPQFRNAQYICRNATGIVGTGSKFLDYGLKYAGRSRGDTDAMLPFGYPPVEIEASKLQAARSWWAEQGVDQNQFIACFFGTIGRFFDFAPILEVARKLPDESRIKFVFCGHGSSFDELKKETQGMKSILMPGWVDAPRIQALMGIASVGLAPYRQGARMALPNKPIEYFSAGLPVLSSLTGEHGDILEREQCGVNYSNVGNQSFSQALSSLIDYPEKRKEMGRAASRVFEERFSAATIAKKMDEHFRLVQRNFES